MLPTFTQCTVASNRSMGDLFTISRFLKINRNLSGTGIENGKHALGSLASFLLLLGYLPMKPHAVVIDIRPLPSQSSEHTLPLRVAPKYLCNHTATRLCEAIHGNVEKPEGFLIRFRVEGPEAVTVLAAADKNIAADLRGIAR